MRHILFGATVLGLAIAVGACHQATPQQSTPVAGFVTDLKAFDAFIASHPTPEQFRTRYPDVQLVLPGTMTTMDFRTNNSRYYAELSEDGHITGGRFG